MIGSSSSSTCRKMERKFENAVPPTSSIDLAGTAFGCHSAARPQWDLVCETDHGCAPLPVTHAMTRALQRTDPRCGNQPISPADAEAIKQLEQLLKAPG